MANRGMCWLDGRPLGHAVGLLARFAANNYTNWFRRIERLSAYILSIRTFVRNDAATRRNRQIKEGMPKRTHWVIHDVWDTGLARQLRNWR